MDFTLSFEQQALVDSLTAFVERELYPHEDIVEQLRAVPQEIADDIKRKARDAGYISMNMPEELGGAGLDHQTMTHVARVMG
jgi:acyl-CoA dehydrogenase